MKLKMLSVIRQRAALYLIMLALARRREMPAYIIADATIHDIEKHRAVFLPAVDELIARMGGKILARTSNPNHFDRPIATTRFSKDDLV